MRLRRIALTVVPLVMVGVVGAAAPASAGGFCVVDGISTGRGTDVVMKGNCFEPRVLYVDPGARVGFTNLDRESHTVTAPGDWGTYHDALVKNDTVRFAFKQEGVYPYVCLLHPGMVGAIVVGDGRAGKIGAANTGFVPPDQLPPPDQPAAAPAAADAPADAGTSNQEDGTKPVLAFALALAVVLLVAAIGALVANRRRPDEAGAASQPGRATT